MQFVQYLSDLILRLRLAIGVLLLGKRNISRLFPATSSQSSLTFKAICSPVLNLEEITENVRYDNNLSDPTIWDKQWIICPDGTLGVIDHVKPQSDFIAIRPVNPETLSYFPNKSKHWTEEQKASVPYEIVIHKDLVRPAPKAAIPRRN